MVVVMLLTNPRRKMIYGLSWTLLGAAAVCFLCLYPRFSDAEQISGSLIHYNFLRFGVLDWLWITQQRSFLTIPPSITWTFQIQWLGLVGNLLVIGLVVWLCRKGWRRSVRSVAIRGPNCDTCGYDLQGSAGNRCPECGEKANNQLIPVAKLWPALGHVLFSAFILCYCLFRPLLALGLLLDTTGKLISVVVWSFLLSIILFAGGMIVLYPWVLSGRVDFEDKDATPRRRKSVCLWMAWVPALIVLLGLVCEMIFYFYNAPLYHDADATKSLLLWWLPATVLYGGSMHVILARRLRKSFRRSGVCFACAKKLVEGEEVVCDECQAC